MTSGSRMYVRASRSTGGATVALSSSVCRSVGQRRRIFSISGRKPMSSIRSASSSTTIRMDRKSSASAADEVDHAAGRADDDVGPALELGDLSADRFAAVDGHAAEFAGHGRAFRILRGLARPARASAPGRAPAATAPLPPCSSRLDDRNGEGGRFAGAGAGLAEDVDAGQRVRNDSGLDRASGSRTRPAQATPT